ncbi:DUF4142 domain-containing protein [Dyadobacter psychrotolerans]|uniref:DUF4142 domain-containing protein n=1 Tax=Dyadobacter psychrotolerans TaxID=2541721 RepID=A0A4R5DSG4_9BACT|nr:DUF4142 domain-containing protein [Dyadobacter psychrotolerans]TDE17372.1 DUF4142 domain-containing protein [Dyadobacter psychrotolerans]
MKTLFISALILTGLQFAVFEASSQTAPAQDTDFVKKAAEGGMLEVNLGQLALKNGESQEVKNFAKMMVDDHTKVNGELMALVKKKKMEVPAQLGSTKKMMTDSLASQSGSSFDMLYMNMMIASHEETIGLFQDESTGGKDADLKKWAGAKIPALKHHLEMAKKLFKTN